MKKVKLFDKNIIRDFTTVISIPMSIYTFASIFYDLPIKNNIYIVIIVVILICIIYIYIWYKANHLTEIKLNINESDVIIKFDDIFNQSDFKVIAFNEYFDTIVDDKIISGISLNGIFVNDYLDEDIKSLDKKIETYLEDCDYEINENRRAGKNKKYPLGTIYKHSNDFLLTALTKFGEDNRANITINDYMNFAFKFWDELDKIYSSRPISIPIFGSGITRFENYNNITDQELLEILIFTFKISKIKFSYPSKVTIIIHKEKRDKINLFKLKEIE